MSNNVKKLSIILMFFVLVFLFNAFTVKVFSADLTFNYDKKTDGGNEYWHFPSNFYCVENGQHLYQGAELNKVRTVNINGLNSNYSSNKIQNGVMAYILSQDDGEDSVHWSTTGYEFYTEKQKAIYGYFQKWLDANGIRDFSTVSGGMSDDALVNRGIEYATNIQNIKEAYINNKTDKNKISIETYNYNQKEYIKVGPLSWEYYEGLDSVKVTNQDKNIINGVLYGAYKGTNLTISSSPSDLIKSNNEFYVLVPIDSNATKINVTGNVSTTRSVIWADVDFYSGMSSDGIKWQNIIKENTGTYTSKTSSSNTIEDIELFIDLSGFVWVDKQSGKQSVTNDLYKDNTHPNVADYRDTEDVSYNGLTVRLKDTAGNVIGETKTSELGKYSEIDGGEYLFKKVLISKLSSYYVEFEYDGLTYTNVVAHTDKNSGSKAIEGETTRNNFNLTFSSIENGVAKDQKGSISHSNMTYTVKDHVATFDHKDFYAIQSKTSETPYNLFDEYKKVGGTELRYVNLGLYQREQPDIAIVKDVQNAKLSINGYNHLYNYASRFDNSIDYTNEASFNVGVQFASKRIQGSYSRPVYKSDADYTNPGNNDKELKVAITYRIDLVNQSTNLAMKVNNIVDYFDNDYTIKAVGTGVDGNGDVTGTLGYSATQAYNADYNKTIIDTSSLGNIGHQSAKSVYVQFIMGRSTVVNLLNQDAPVPLNNVTEINSYSVFDGAGKVYAGVDKDSNPGNTVPGNIDTYEDDTDKAPAFKLELRDDRVMTGTVFVDKTSGELKTGEVRKGDGIYKNDEDATVRGVKVTLHEVGSAGVEDKVVETDENGNFKIEGYIPGEYTLTYTWGDDQYNVQNYKAISIDQNRWNEYANNAEWYKSTDPRESDAIDNYDTRQAIDNEIKGMEQKAEENGTLKSYKINKMDSTTQKMSFPIEYKSATSSYNEDKLVYAAENLDFGIVERARQALYADKRVGNIKVTLANGQVVIDAQIDENGKITGQHQYLTYMGPSATSVPANGYVKIELDNELIEGSTLEIGYIIETKNISEKDFVSKDFYTFGKETGDPVTITPTLYDYMDNTMVYDSSSTDWKEVSVSEYNDSKQTDPTITETNSVTITREVDEAGNIVIKVREDSSSESKSYSYSEWKKELISKRQEGFNSKIILSNPDLYKPIATGQSNKATLNTSKLLANTDEIDLNNKIEVTKVEKNGGSEFKPNDSQIVDSSETVTVIPSTGQDKGFVMYIVIGTIALAILATGIVIIRKKTLGNKD